MSEQLSPVVSEGPIVEAISNYKGVETFTLTSLLVELPCRIAENVKPASAGWKRFPAVDGTQSHSCASHKHQYMVHAKCRLSEEKYK